MGTISKDHICYRNLDVLRPVEDLGLSQRDLNALKATGINCIGELITTSEYYLKNTDDLGLDGFCEVERALKEKFGLSLAIECNKILATATEVENFFGLATKVELYANVVLPVSLVEAFDDARVVRMIVGVCQSAFNKAVRHELRSALSSTVKELGINLDNVVTEEFDLQDTVEFPTGETKNFSVRVRQDPSLEGVFHGSLFDKAAKSISGVTLYSTIKCELEAHLPKPV